MYFRTDQRGFTLTETFIYAAGVILVVGVIVSLLYYTYGWYGAVATPARADQLGISLADKIQNDIRSGQSVNTGSTVWGSANGALSMQAFTSPTVTATKYYYLQNGRLMYQEGSAAAKALSPADVTVSQFYLTQISTPVSTGIRFVLGITYTSRQGSSVSPTYAGVAIMRNTYQ